MWPHVWQGYACYMYAVVFRVGGDTRIYLWPFFHEWLPLRGLRRAAVGRFNEVCRPCTPLCRCPRSTSSPTVLDLQVKTFS